MPDRHVPHSVHQREREVVLSLSQTDHASGHELLERAVRPPQSRAGWQRRLGLLPTTVFALFAFFGVAFLETFSVNAERPVAVLFPERVSEEQAFAAVVAAGGLPIRAERSVLSDGVVWIAAADAPDFFDAVRSRGAWAVINPYAFGGCFLVKPA